MRNLLMRRLRTWRIIFTAPSSDGEGYHDVALKLILPAEVMLTLSHMAAGPRCAAWYRPSCSPFSLA